MSFIRPFRALRPSPETASRVASVPYDVVSTEEAHALAQDNPLSFLHVSRPEIDLPPGTPIHSEAAYAQARKAFDELRAKAPLERDDKPGLFAYRLKRGGHAQTGLIACFSIDEYDQGAIKKHEKTRQDKEDDRTRHLLSVSAQTGLVFLTYRARSAIDRAMAETTAQAPLYDFVAPDGIAHTVWRLKDSARMVELFADVPALYIADGHHRAASASRARGERRATNPAHRGDEDYNFLLAVAFPDRDLRILPYFRVMKDLNGFSPDRFLNAVGERFEVSAASSAEPAAGEFAMYYQGGGDRWHRLRPRTALVGSDPISRLDVSVLQNGLLAPVLGIHDPRTDQRIEFVGGVRGTAELERLVRSGRAAVAFSLHPTTTDELISIADAGAIMPPKSTWFEPKLRDGLVSYLI